MTLLKLETRNDMGVSYTARSHLSFEFTPCKLGQDNFIMEDVYS